MPEDKIPVIPRASASEEVNLVFEWYPESDLSFKNLVLDKSGLKFEQKRVEGGTSVSDLGLQLSGTLTLLDKTTKEVVYQVSFNDFITDTKDISEYEMTKDGIRYKFYTRAATFPTSSFDIKLSGPDLLKKGLINKK